MGSYDLGGGTPGRIRTRDPLLRRQPLYPLSYWGLNSIWRKDRRLDSILSRLQ